MPDRDRLMAEALDLARRGRGSVEPNPMVGAVVVRDGEIVARGYHRSYGGPHAEIEALAAAGDAAAGADVYVTLEPCTSFGKTPPCADALIAAGVARVVFATADPDPRHRGAAVEVLRGAGVDVIEGPRSDAADALLEPFRRYCEGSLPFVLAKWASTLDGRIAARTGDSKWITGEEARILAHEERARADAILVGIGTVLADDPALTTRHVEGASPRRIVVDPNLRTPPTARVLSEEGGALILTAAVEAEPRERLEAAGATLIDVPRLDGVGLDLIHALAELRRLGVGRLLVEGGGRTLGGLVSAKLVDRVQVHIAPRLLGDAAGVAALSGAALETIADATDLEDVRIDHAGRDIIISGELTKSRL